MVPSVPLLVAGRTLGGVSTSLLFSVFESWMVDKAEFEKLGYPKPHVDWKESKERCIQRYKQDMADADP